MFSSPSHLTVTQARDPVDSPAAPDLPDLCTLLPDLCRDNRPNKQPLNPVT